MIREVYLTIESEILPMVIFVEIFLLFCSLVSKHHMALNEHLLTISDSWGEGTIDH